MIEERQQKREIGGVMYKAQPIAFGLGVKALMRLIKIISPIVSAATRAQGAREQAASVLEVLPEALTDDDVIYFAELFGKASWYLDGEEDGEGAKWPPLNGGNRETHFAGRYLEFLRWLLFCIEVNYGNFFDGMKSGGGDLAAFIKTATGAPQPSTSIPGSG